VIVLDTTVLVYAVGGDHLYREPSRALVDAISSGALQATTTVEVIQEFAHVRARRRGKADARRVAAAYVDLLAPLIATTEAHLRSGLELWARSKSLGAFDAVLAMLAVDLHAEALVSSDRAFGRVRDLTHVVPDERGLVALLDR
jgi:uncharacterized protein